MSLEGLLSYKWCYPEICLVDSIDNALLEEPGQALWIELSKLTFTTSCLVAWSVAIEVNVYLNIKEKIFLCIPNLHQLKPVWRDQVCLTRLNEFNKFDDGNLKFWCLQYDQFCFLITNVNFQTNHTYFNQLPSWNQTTYEAQFCDWRVLVEILLVHKLIKENHTVHHWKQKFSSKRAIIRFINW